MFQIQRMARHGLWLNVGMILGGLVLSSAMVRIPTSCISVTSTSSHMPADHHGACYLLPQQVAASRNKVPCNANALNHSLTSNVHRSACPPKSKLSGMHGRDEFRCGVQVTVYWLSHYPTSVAGACVDWRPPNHVERDQADPRCPGSSKSALFSHPFAVFSLHPTRRSRVKRTPLPLQQHECTAGLPSGCPSQQIWA